MHILLVGVGGADDAPATVAAVAVLLGTALVAAWALHRGFRRPPDRPHQLVLRASADGALISLGVLAVVDNVVFHWLLRFHRFKDGWGGSIYVEVAIVVIGVLMVALGITDLRRHLTSASAATRSRDR